MATGKDIVLPLHRTAGDELAVGATVIEAIRRALELDHESCICLPQETAMRLLREFEDAQKGSAS